MTMTIRPLAYADRARWEHLFRGYATFYKTSISPEGIVVVWDWIFDEGSEFWCDVAVDAQGTVIGLAHYHLLYRPVGGGMICFLSDLFVEPGCRGSGAGRALINRVRQFAGDQGLPKLRWVTQEFNYPARTLYDSYSPRSDFILYDIDITR